MGNCCRRESSTSVVWAADDWETDPAAGHDHERVRPTILLDADGKNKMSSERQRLLGGGGDEGSSSDTSLLATSASGGTREVKIKISKKELEDLMARVEMQGFTMEQLLTRLLNSNSDDHQIAGEEEDHHHWKPGLQSIPE